MCGHLSRAVSSNAHRGLNFLTFSALTFSSSTLCCNAADACLYSSKSLYAANDEANENPKRKPTILRALSLRYSAIKSDYWTHPPRMPPTGFFAGAGVPIAGAASLLKIRVVEISLEFEGAAMRVLARTRREADMTSLAGRRTSRWK
jgi:hypothetical protein